MAIELTYESCLKEGALDDALVDFLEVKERREQQEIQRREWEEE